MCYRLLYLEALIKDFCRGDININNYLEYSYMNEMYEKKVLVNCGV
jgi:hypothetical protein